MGLDNGIIFKNKKDIPNINDIPNFVSLDDNEICYWRKCWGIRDSIIHILHMNNDEYEKEIELDDFKPLIESLELFYDENYWNNFCNSIWEYKNYITQHKQNIRNLLWAWDYKKKHPEVEIYFYDSY